MSELINATAAPATPATPAIKSKASNWKAIVLVLCVLVVGIVHIGGYLVPVNQGHAARARATYRLPGYVAVCLPAPKVQRKFIIVKTLSHKGQLRAWAWGGIWHKVG